MPRQPFRILPKSGQGFAVDAAEHGALKVTMASVSQTKPVMSKSLSRVVSRLKSLLGLEPPAKPVLLLLYEDPAALPVLQKIARAISERDVKLQPASSTLLDPGSMADLEKALLQGSIDECMLIAGSSAGASKSHSRAMHKLGQVYEGTLRVRQAYLGGNGRLRLLADPGRAPVAARSPSSLQPVNEDPRKTKDPGPDPGG